MTGFVLAADATTGNVGALPAGYLPVGYTTGQGVAWTQEQWAAHPGAVRICQDAGATDGTADVLDIETGAATPADAPGWYKRALANFTAATRPGQRKPALYVNGSNLTTTANALVAGGVSSGPGIYLAKPGIIAAAADQILALAGGPFPIVGVQFAWEQDIDLDVFSSAWADDVSAAQPDPPPDPAEWKFPAPAALAASHVSKTGYRLSWDAVTGPAGQKPVSYTVATWQMNGVQVDEFAVLSGTSTSEYGKGGTGLHPGWTYETRVWANGGPVGPPHAEIEVSLPA